MYQTKRITTNKALALLLSVSLLLTAVLGGTFAQVITRTPSFINTFLSGLDPTGDLVIRKEITHPFGSGYSVPGGLSFDFTVSLGEHYAGKTVVTSQGEKIADENGNITVSTAPEGAVRIKDLADGTSVTVTEAPRAGFTPNGGAEQLITIQSGDNEVIYTNTYAPGPVENVNLTVSGTKLLEGREWQEGDSFTLLLEYKLAGEGQDWQRAGTTVVSYDPADPDFNKFSFTELVQGVPYAAAGEYSFRVSEVEGTVGGITYDKVVSYFDVLVGDQDMDGALEIQDVTGYQNAAASYDETIGSFHVDVTVNNQYAPAGTAGVTIQVDKTVLSSSGEEKSYAGYTFELYDESGSLVATSGETSAAGETAIALTFEAKDAGTTFHYTLKETHSGETHNGLTYDSTVYRISVSVVDNLDGTISAYIYNTADYRLEELPEEPQETEPEETESVSAETEPVPTETEPVPTETESVAEETEPEMTEPETVETEPEATETESVPVESEPMSSASAPVETAEVSELSQEETPSELIPADDIPEENADEPETGKSPVIPQGAGDTYRVSFVNIYDPADTQTSFGGVKTLAGRTLKEGEFCFDLYATGSGFAIAEGQGPVQSVSHDANGDFWFAAISYDKVGVYRYVVKENDADKLGGVEYDDSVYHVIVTVTDENGVLNASAAITDELGAPAAIKFHNTYSPGAASVIFSGTKTLTGKGLTADMFCFLLYQTDADHNISGDPAASASNDELGNFVFEEIRYSETGTFYYVVKEDASAGVEGMSYDDTAYGIRVDVWDDGAGSLHADAAICIVGGGEADAIAFENHYTKPAEPTEPTDPTDVSDPTEPPETTEPSEPTDPPETTEPTEQPKPTTPADPDIPPTGDNSAGQLYLTLAIISTAAIILLLATDRRKKHCGRFLR